MKKLFTHILLILLLASCSQDQLLGDLTDNRYLSTSIEDSRFQLPVPCNGTYESSRFVNLNEEEVGEMRVWHNTNFLIIWFEIDDEYTLDASACYVGNFAPTGLTAADYPNQNGHQKMGKRKYAYVFNAHNFNVSTLAIALSIDIIKEGKGSRIWAFGDEVEEGEGMYNTYTMTPCTTNSDENGQGMGNGNGQGEDKDN